MSISLIIPTLRVGNKLEKALESMKGQYDQLIVIDDKNANLAVKINKGISQAECEYLVISNDDVLLTKGTLKDLCIKDKVVLPEVKGSINKLFHAHMWCMSADVCNKCVGTIEGWSDYGRPGYFEGYFRSYWDDVDYQKKIEANEIKIIHKKDVEILHDDPAWTLRRFDNNSKAESINETIFNARWQ